MTSTSVNARSSAEQPQQSVALLLHELRSPLASIRNAIAILRIRSEDEALQQRMHDLIERQVHQMTLLTAGFWPPPENRRPQLARIDLCTVLRQAGETVAPEFNARRHELLVDAPE